MINRFAHSVILGVFLALLMNCSSSMANYQDSRFAPYINEFIRLSKLVDPVYESQIKMISVVFGKIEENEYAVFKFFDNIIVVNEKSWVKLTLAEREELIFHELGHAILYLGHEDQTIMQAKGMLGEKYYIRYYPLLLNIHFGCIPKWCINEVYDINKYEETFFK